MLLPRVQLFLSILGLSGASCPPFCDSLLSQAPCPPGPSEGGQEGFLQPWTLRVPHRAPLCVPAPPPSRAPRGTGLVDSVGSCQCVRPGQGSL